MNYFIIYFLRLLDFLLSYRLANFSISKPSGKEFLVQSNGFFRSFNTSLLTVNDKI